jgi:thioredoxin reductase
MYTRIPFTHHSEIADKIGCKLSESGHILADEKQKTSVPGVFAAGDCSTNGRAVSIAVSAGTVAGMMINSELVFKQVGE